MKIRVTHLSVGLIGFLCGCSSAFALSKLLIRDTDPFEQQVLGWTIAVITGLVVFWTMLCISIASER